jgi:hypothetical protein
VPVEPCPLVPWFLSPPAKAKDEKRIIKAAVSDKIFFIKNLLHLIDHNTILDEYSTPLKMLSMSIFCYSVVQTLKGLGQGGRRVSGQFIGGPPRSAALPRGTRALRREGIFGAGVKGER